MEAFSSFQIEYYFYMIHIYSSLVNSCTMPMMNGEEMSKLDHSLVMLTPGKEDLTRPEDPTAACAICVANNLLALCHRKPSYKQAERGLDKA